MRIESVEAIPVSYPEPNDHNATRHLCLVRVSAEGAVGWGEAVTMWPEASQAMKVIVEQGFAPFLLGRDPIENGVLWREMKEHTWWYGLGGIASFAIAAVDIALWDLKGKSLGARVVDLLGGPVRDRLPAMACGHGGDENLGVMADEIAGWLSERNLHGIKVGYGKRGNARLGYEHDRDVEFVRLIRERIGPDKAIMIDLGNAIRWDVTTAVERTRAMEEYDLAWIEEPLGGDNPEGYATLREKTTTRIAYGEREWNLRGYERIIDSGTVDVIGVDPGRAEGISGFIRVCGKIEEARRQANAHAWSSAIVTAASLAVSFSQPACKSFEVKPRRNPMQHELVPRPLDPVDGWMLPPEGPGLGIEVIEEVVDFYRSERQADHQ